MNKRFKVICVLLGLSILPAKIIAADRGFSELRPQPGKLIILNGGSSAGKTSLAKAFQSISDETFLLMGIDLFWFTLPPKQTDLQKVEPEYYSWAIEESDGKPVFHILPGPILDQLMIGRYQAIAAYLQLGFNVIADDVIWKRLWLEECLKAIEPYQTFFIHVYCSDEEGSRREQLRGDRYPGWHRGSAYYSNSDAIYDLEIDTSIDCPETCAAKLKAALKDGLKPTAVIKMHKLMRPALSG